MWCNVVGYTFLNIKHFIVVHINSLKPLLLSLLLSEDKPWHISFKWTFISIVLTHQTFCKFPKFWNVHTIYNCCHVSKTCCSCKLSNWSWVRQIVFKYRYSLIKDLLISVSWIVFYSYCMYRYMYWAQILRGF